MGDATSAVARDSYYQRERSPSSYSWRSQSSPRWRSPSTQSTRYSSWKSRSPRPWRSPSPSPYRDWSQSPPPRGDLSPRRRRSPSPPNNFSRGDTKRDEIRRIKLLAKKVMSMATFRRVVGDSKSPWSNAKKSVKMPIPIPLNPGERVADYMRKFEFWLAQRNMTLASLQGDPSVERSYRYSYAYWRLVKADEQSSTGTEGAQEANLQASTVPTWNRKRNVSQCRPSEQNAARQSNRDYMQHDDRADVSTNSTRNNKTPPTSMTSSGSPRDRDAWHSSRSYSEEKRQEVEKCCETCGRKWGDLSRRLKKLEEIVARFELSSGGMSTDPYSNHADLRDEPSPQPIASVLIDLTGDMEPVVDGTSMEITPKETQIDEVQDKPAEISPSTEGDNTHEQSMIASDLHFASDEAPTNSEAKAQCSLASLITAYNRLNDQVLLNEKVEEDALSRMESTIGEDQATAVELRSQIYELRASIKVEQDKRDVAVAAVIAFSYAEKRDALSSEINASAAPGVANDYQSLHEECTSIASKIAEKNNKLARLQKELAAQNENSNTVEAEQLLSKIGLERASKAQLEADRHKIFLRLMKSNRHIQTLVKTELEHT